jgi:hypothetical protein
MQGPLREDLARISTRSSDKDLYRASYRTPPGSPQDLLTMTLTRPWPRSSYITDLSCKIAKEGPSRELIYLFTMISKNQRKSASHHGERGPTRANCQEGCASGIKIRCATTRAIRHAQSAERVAREYVAVKKPGATERRLT